MTPSARKLLPGQLHSSGNPILPGYYADPAFIAYQGANYIYATLDPWGDETLACWESSDSKNWTYRVLNWPTKSACTSPTSGPAGVWAPSIVRTPDGRFLMAVSVGNEVWLGLADHPLGPWRNILGDRPFIPYHYKPGYHMIDAELFVDDDGQVYIYWGSGWNWVNGRCWVGRLGPDLASFAEAPLDVTPANYFEAPFMVKRHGKYFLMYSSGNTTKDTYQVHYAVGDSPCGPFVEGPASPVLVTDHAEHVVSPGHHAVFHHDGRDYILYHRHSIPFDPDVVGRQVCVDEIRFTGDGRIEAIVATHAGPDFVQGRVETRNVLDSIIATASSQASVHTSPAFVLDANYATRWAAAPSDHCAWLQLDLGAAKAITSQLLRPEYAWKPLFFTIEASLDGAIWHLVADFTTQPAIGSPIVIEQAVNARYLRLVHPTLAASTPASWIGWKIF